MSFSRVIPVVFGLLIGLSASSALWSQEPLPTTDLFQINTYTPNIQADPHVSLSQNGEFVVVWLSFEYWDDVEGGRIRAQRFGAEGAPQGDEFLVHPESLNRQSSQRVSHADDGSFLITWHEPPKVMGRFYDPVGLPQAPPMEINSDSEGQLFFGGGLSRGPEDGALAVAWSFDRDDGAGGDIWGQRLAADGTLLDSQFRVNTYTTGEQSDPRISHSPDGSFVIVWESADQDGSSWGVYGQRFASDGQPLGEEFQISTQTLNAQLSPHVSHGLGGEFVVVWLDGPSSQRRLFGRLFDSSGQPTDSEFEIAPEILNGKFWPDIAHDSHGDFLVVWADIQEGFEADPLGQRLSAQGLPVGEPFAVTPFVPGEQTNPRIASGAAGSLVVVWHSDEEGATSLDSYGRLFCSDHDADQVCDGLLDDGFESGDLSRWSNAVPAF